MARYEHIKIFQLCYRITIKKYRIASDFNREYKYTLGEKLKEKCHELLDLIIETNSNLNKAGFFGKLRSKLESIKIYYKIAHSLNALDLEQFNEITLDLDEIGKQLHNWQNWAKKQ